MRTKTGPNGSADRHVKEIKRKTRRKFSAEEKIRIVLDGLRGESSISELCRREGIAESLYYNWSKDFMEAGKKRLAGDIQRQATSGEVNRPGFAGDCLVLLKRPYRMRLCLHSNSPLLLWA